MLHLLQRHIPVIKYIFILFFIASPAYSATYYIDYVSGADANNGTSTSTPFKHCPGDPRASDNANITLSAGDIVVFEGGVTYEFASGDSDSYISANASGTTGNVIEYRSGDQHSPQWGTTRAIIDGTYSNLLAGNRMGVIDLQGYSYITVNGLEITKSGDLSPDDPYVGLLAWDATTGSNIIVKNNYIHYSDSTLVFFEGGNAGPPSNFTIQDNIFENSHSHCLNMRYAINSLTIQGNTFDECGNSPYGTPTINAGNAIIFAGYAADDGPTDVSVIGNTFHNTGTPKKHDIFMQNAITNITIEDNWFDGSPGVSSTGSEGNHTNVTFRNNVWHTYGDAFEGILRFRSTAGAGYGTINGLNIHNNTIVSIPGATSGLIFFDEGNNTDNGPHYINVDIRNNIIDSIDSTTDYLIEIQDADDGTPLVQMSTLTIDNNAYQSDKATPFYTVDGGAMSFADWKTHISGLGATGSDANSNFGQVSFTNEAENDFTLLASDTIALDEGVDLSAEGFSDDKNGTTRPQGSAWDIGAYEYSVGTNNSKSSTIFNVSGSNGIYNPSGMAWQ